MKFVRGVCYFIVQWTWGMMQTLFGMILFLRYIKSDHIKFHGAIATYVEGNGGCISLGYFIFIRKGRGAEAMQPITVHEYGHTVQSLILGPLYLLAIGIPSFVWAKSKIWIDYREKHKVAYTSFWCEKWANASGERLTGKKAWDK